MFLQLQNEENRLYDTNVMLKFVDNINNRKVNTVLVLPESDA
jgi:hypothetical protein